MPRGENTDRALEALGKAETAMMVTSYATIEALRMINEAETAAHKILAVKHFCMSYSGYHNVRRLLDGRQY